MPKLGFNMDEGKLVEWYKQVGDEIKKGEPLFSVETDKTNMDIEATGDGVVRAILINAGDKIPVTLSLIHISILICRAIAGRATSDSSKMSWSVPSTSLTKATSDRSICLITSSGKSRSRRCRATHKDMRKAMRSMCRRSLPFHT